MKCLVAMHDKLNHGVVFFEHNLLTKVPHCVIECVATPKEIDDQVPLYFRKVRKIFLEL